MPYANARPQAPCTAGCGRWTRRPAGTCSFCAGKAAPTTRVRVTDPAALVEDAEWLARTGETLDGALPRLGVSEYQLTVHLNAAGRGDVLDALRRNQQPVNA